MNLNEIDISELSYDELRQLRDKIEFDMSIKGSINKDEHKDWIGKIIYAHLDSGVDFYGKVTGCENESLICSGYRIDFIKSTLEHFSWFMFVLNGHENLVEETDYESFAKAFQDWLDFSKKSMWKIIEKAE